MLDAGTAADEGAGLEVVGGAQAVVRQKPAQADHGAAEQPHVVVQADRQGTGLLHRDIGVVVQIGADAGQFGDHTDAMSAQIVGRTDTRQQQELRRVDGTACQDHLTVSASDGLGAGAASSSTTRRASALVRTVRLGRSSTGLR